MSRVYSEGVTPLIRQKTIELMEEIKKCEDPIFNGNAKEVLNVGCYACNGPLQIAYVPGGKSLLGDALQIGCQKCPYESSSDGLSHEPPWVKELGTDILTEPKNEAGQD